ncbi:MAG: hypothetical protein II583_04335 [Oscillospiraceae bacterium]|nr:hypothetical protein [Oscillospiraceae bacterium]
MELLIILGVIIAIEGAVIMAILGIKALGGFERKTEGPAESEEPEDRKGAEREAAFADGLSAIQGYDYNAARRAVNRFDGYDGAEDEE